MRDHSFLNAPEPFQLPWLSCFFLAALLVVSQFVDARPEPAARAARVEPRYAAKVEKSEAGARVIRARELQATNAQSEWEPAGPEPAR